LREKINFSPSKGQFKVYIIDEVHMLSNAAFNAILKTLEEPPQHAIFILATTEPQKIPATVISRCQRFDFRRIPLNYIVSQLQQIAAGENIRAEPEALTLIARHATGSMRDAISLLDQLASSGEPLDLQRTQAVLGAATSEHVIRLAQALASRKVSNGLTAIQQALDGGTDPRQFARQTVDFLRGILLTKLGNADQLETTAEMKKQMLDLTQRFTLEELVQDINLFNRAAFFSPASWQPALQLELALTEALEESHPAGQSSDQNSRPVSQEVKKSTARPSPSPRPSQATVSPTAQTGQAAQPGNNEAPASKRPAESGGASSTENPDLKKILDQWVDIKAAVKPLSAETAALLTSAKLVSMQNQKLLLGFASELLKTKMESNNHIDLARRKIKELSGIDIPILCTVVNINDKTITTNMNIDRDGMVGTALAMGGKIVAEEEKEKPSSKEPQNKE